MSTVPRPVLITGASGYLGRHLTRRALTQIRAPDLLTSYAHSPERICGGTATALDLTTDAAEETIYAHAPRAIIHAAAAPPGSSNADLTRIIVDGTRRVARVAAALDARLVHVSTDVLHDGRSAPYADDARPTPTEPYSRAKALAEEVVLEVCPSAAIIRTSLIYGLDEMDRSCEEFARRLAAGSPVRLFRDVLRQPVWVESLAEALLMLALERTEFSGHLNVVGDQVISREAFARKLLTWWRVPGRDAAESIRAATLASPPPLDLRLDNQLAKARLGLSLPGVDAVLAKRQATAPRGSS